MPHHSMGTLHYPTAFLLVTLPAFITLLLLLIMPPFLIAITTTATHNNGLMSLTANSSQHPAIPSSFVHNFFYFHLY